MTPTQPTPTWPRYFKAWSDVILRFDGPSFGTFLISGRCTTAWDLETVTSYPELWTEITATEAAEMVAERSKQ